MHAVLVVDIDEEIARSLEGRFEPGKYEVHRAKTLEHSRSMLATVLYSVVIVTTLFVRSEARSRRARACCFSGRCALMPAAFAMVSLATRCYHARRTRRRWCA